jgi:hypothetical protein
MTEKELLEKLNSFKAIKLDSDFKEESGRILYSQISNSSGGFTANLNIFQKAFEYIAQPIWAVFFAVLVIGAGIFGVNASNYADPSDSLYIAKIISNKAKLAITFDEEKKTKMGIRFASDHAKDITKFLASSEPAEENKETEKLTKNFKKQIDSVKTKLKEIKVVKEEDKENKDEKENEALNDDEEMVFGANLGKEETGMQVLDPNNSVSLEPDQPENPEIEAEPEVSDLNNGDNGEENASGTEEIKEEDADIVNNDDDLKKAERILSEAEILFDSKNYNEALKKLDEAGLVIDDINGEEGEVKGEFEVGSSTEKENF